MLQRRRSASGITLIELMVVVAITALLALLVAPSFQEMILMQRLKGVNAQLVTDLQFARAEAAARGKYVRFNFGSDAAQTCYVIYTAEGNALANRCNCLSGAGATCTAASSVELRTVSLPRSSGVVFGWAIPPSAPADSAFAFDHVTGGLLSVASDTNNPPLPAAQVEARIDSERRLIDKISATGRPTVCSPNPGRMRVSACES